MARDIREIQVDLNHVKNAIAKHIQGKRINQLSFGSGESLRIYKFAEITYDKLIELKKEYEAELAIAQGGKSTERVFRSQDSFPVIVSKYGE